MAREADLIGFRVTKLNRISNVFRGRRLGVFASWTMTGFACLPNTSELLSRLNRMMRTLAERQRNVFVASLANFGAYILSHCNGGRNFCRLRLRLLLPGQHKGEQAARSGECKELPSRLAADCFNEALTAHATWRRRIEHSGRGTYRNFRPKRWY